MMRPTILRARLKAFLQTKPQLYDLTMRARRATGHTNDLYECLDQFSRAHRRRVRFIQLGANDGLRNDPIREFIVRDHWQGILVEPVPYAFELLRKNYRGRTRSNLTFVNAAITIQPQDSLPLWTFRSSFLERFPLAEQLSYLRKSSVSRAFIEGFVPSTYAPAQVLETVNVPCITLEKLLERFGQSAAYDLLVTDVEGYEVQLLPALDFAVFRPTAILFEAEHLKDQRSAIFEHLESNGYQIRLDAENAFALRL